MSDNSSNRTRPACGASLGAMLILLDLRPETVVDHCGSAALADAIEHCLDCPTDTACARWLADPERRLDAWRGFCPNAALFEQTATRRPNRVDGQIPPLLDPPSRRK